MAIVAAVTNNFKAQVLAGLHQPGDDYRIALYVASASLSKDTNAYTAAGEVTGAGYAAGGVSLTNYTAGDAADVAWIDWDDPVWPSATFTARGALIYNATRENAAVAVLDFGADVSCTGVPFSVEFPVPGSTTAIVRIA
jgi:hypothetical protein